MSEVCGYAARGDFFAVFRFSQNFDAVFGFLTFLRFAVLSIFVRFFGFCRIFLTVFTEISSGFSAPNNATVRGFVHFCAVFRFLPEFSYGCYQNFERFLTTLPPYDDDRTPS